MIGTATNFQVPIMLPLKIRYFALLLFAMLFLKAAAQENMLPKCGSDALLSILRKDPAFVENEKNLNTAIRNKILFKKNQPTVVYTIPVVFHIVNSNAASITDLMVINALKELNDAFAHLGVYGVDPLGANTMIQFCLARTDPNGGLTSGIDRVNSYYENIDVDLESDKLGNLTNWDPSKYANIWVVNSIQGEIPPSPFSCGVWTRSGYGGYASAGVGAVVSGLSTPLVAHEMGHYLSLLHTFQGTNCINNDCTKDGDLVCDTPPDRSTLGSACSNPENSCNTDTISGPFTKDVPDNISNFMDYGSPCPTVFTQGQADRMRAFLESFNGGSLIASNRCKIPCAENIQTSFDWNTNPHPIIGDQVQFNNSSTGATNYEWYVNGVLVSNVVALKYVFPLAGKYEIKLKAYNADNTCFGSYVGNVIVDCGVASRFSPDKRIIASETGIYNDTVRFVNKSYGATAFKWYVSDYTGGNITMVSTDKDLSYMFPRAGSYSIRLESTNGTCKDVSRTYTMNVLDPKPDGMLSIYDVDCYKNDSIRIVFGIYNAGFDTIPANMPVTFYDRDPAIPGAQKLKNTFVTDKQILGRCGFTYTHIIAANRAKLDTVFAVFDEQDSLLELSNLNNRSSRTNFQFRITVSPVDTTVYTNSDVQLQMKSTGDNANNIKWTAKATSNCVSCTNPIFRIVDSTRVKGYAESSFGCADSAYSNVNVFPIDIFLTTNAIFCSKNDSLVASSVICLANGYSSLKQNIEMRYFDADTLAGPANLLGTATILRTTAFNNLCLLVRHRIKMSATGKVFAYINGDLKQFESNLNNNRSNYNYVPFTIDVPNDEIDVFRGVPTQLTIINGGEKYKTLLWTPSNQLSCSTCPDPVLKGNTNTLLKVVGSSEYGCRDSATIKVNVFWQNHLILPNVFTPDGDGLNDNFYVIAGKDVKMVKQFQVFNRWGQKVFEKTNGSTNDYASGWNGTFKGIKAPMGTYVYLIVVELQDGSSETHKGNITLIR